MSSFLARKGHDNPKPVSAARQKIEAALATLPRAETPRQQPAREPTRTNVPAPEIVEIACVCAVFDKPYALRFAKQADGHLRFLESVKDEGLSGVKHRNENPASGHAPKLVISVRALGNVSRPCAWCGNGSFHHCASDCGALVCGGLMKGETFHCRKSCGASWVGVPLEQIEGRKKEETPQPSMRPPRQAPAATRAPVRERPLLSAGTSLVKR